MGVREQQQGSYFLSALDCLDLGHNKTQLGSLKRKRKLLGSSEIAHRIGRKLNGIKLGKLIRIIGNWVAGTTAQPGSS